MRYPRRVVRWISPRLVILCLGLWLIPGVAQADRLTAELAGAVGHGFAPIQELSYETIIEPSSGYDATLKIRSALHNNSARPRDMVLSLALPLSAEITGLRVARDGVWTDGAVTRMAGQSGPRDPGSVFVRPMKPARRGDLPGAEIVAFGIETGATIQVEITTRVFPRLRSGRWELDLPSRDRELRALAQQRRIIVRDVAEFWVGDASNRGQPSVLSGSEYEATVAWPSSIRTGAVFDGRYEVTPNSFGGGQIKVLLRIGPTRAPRPDHLSLVIDRSRSTSAHMQRETMRVTDALLAELPPTTTLDAIGFAREATPILLGNHRPRISDGPARDNLARAMDANTRSQGTDIARALELAIARLSKRGARRPMIVVVTDGMLPTTISPAEVRKRVDRAIDAADVRFPEILFIVDEPLWRLGVSAEQPIARVAAALGARISHKSLSRVHPDTALDLLASPRVLGQLDIDLPQRVHLAHQVPDGLVAGGFTVVHGMYEGKPPRSVRISGRLGNRKVSRRLRLRKRQPPPEALVSSTVADPTSSAAEGFARPVWYGQRDQRLARLGIMNVGRGGTGQKGRLSDRIVQHYLRMRVWPRARVCYNRAIARNQVQGGRVVLEFELGKGEVMMARPSSIALDNPDPQFVACLTEAAWALDIPAAKLDDQAYVVHYPLAFQPPKNGQPPRTTDPLGEGTVDLLLRNSPRGSP